MIDHSSRPGRELLAEMVRALGNLGLPEVVVVGAAARDVWLDELGTIPERATNDVDMGFAVRNWETYATIRRALIEKHGFEAAHIEHRLTHKGRILDLIPYGDIERTDRTIEWPIDRTRMNVLGFSEAATTAETVTLPGGPSVRVATLPALLVLKLIAWHDRRAGRDASDFWTLLSAASESGPIRDRLFKEELPTYEARGFDPGIAAAEVLGRDARAAMLNRNDVVTTLVQVLAAESGSEGSLALIRPGPGATDRKLQQLRAFTSGIDSS